MNKKKPVIKICTFIIMAGLFLALAVPAQAAVKKTSILASGGQKSCRIDLDGDGKKEQLRSDLKYDEYGAITDAALYVNGKKALTLKKPLWGIDFSVDYIKMSKDNIFIRCCMTSDNDLPVSDCFYRYDPESARLAKAAELLDVNGTGSYARIKTVTGSNVKIEYSHWVESAGYIIWTGTYTAADGKLKLDKKASRAKSGFADWLSDPDGYGKLFKKNQYKASRDIIFHKDLSMRHEAYRTEAGDILTLKKIKYTKDNWYLQFEKNGKYGWIDTKSIGGMEIFYGVSSRRFG